MASRPTTTPEMDLATLAGTKEWIAAHPVCEKCGHRKTTHAWGDSLAMTHGWAQPRCDVCVYGPQLAHCAKAALRIPKLGAKLLRAVILDGK